MVKIAPAGGKGLATQKSAASKILKDDQKAGGTSLSKTIGWLNKQGGLQDKIAYSEVIEPLNGLGEKRAQQLLGELAEKAWTIKEPTKWLLKAVENGAKGGGGSKGKGYSKGFGGGSWGFGGMNEWDLLGSLAGSWGMEMPQANSKWVSKAIGLANASGKLKEPIMWKECIGVMSGLPEGVAVDLVKQLEAKAGEVEKPTSWLCAAAKKYNGKWKPGGGVLSKKIGELNNSNKLKSPVMWHEVSGALTLMDEAAAEALIAELEEKAAEVKNPTSWLAGAAKRSFKPKKDEA